MGQSYSVFISAVTREFGAARDALANALQARGIDVKVQRSFGQGDGTTLALLHDYVRKCDRVIAIIGDYAGMYAPANAVTDKFRDMLPPGMASASLTQWEVIFARHYRREIFFFEASGFTPEQDASEGDDAAAQAAWRHWLFDGDQGRFRRQFGTASDLRAHVMELGWRNPAEPKPSNLPGSIGHFFKGRGEFLDQLRESFKHNAATAITSKAVHGLGGVGKTRTAIEYGHACADDYTASLYLIGKSESDLKDSLAALAGAAVLDLPEKDIPDLDVRVVAVIHWLRTNPGWLLIIDNVDDEPAANAARAFLDQVGHAEGHVLITSRVSDWAHGVEPIELDLLSLEAAKDLLRESTPKRTKQADEDAALIRLADEQLGCLSLALVQAAAYIEERRIGFAEYSALFQTEAQKLLARLGKAAVRNLNYPLPVALTWQASFAQLGDAGRLLLDMLAWLSIEPIPRTLFTVWPEDSVDLEEGLTELTHYSFVHWEAENSAITLHRLVAQVTRDNLDIAARDKALGGLFLWLLAVNPRMNAADVRCWPQLMPLLPHALQLFERTDALGPYLGQANVYNQYATLLQSLARYSDAEPLFRQALKFAEELHGPDSSLMEVSLNNLADLLRNTGSLAEAEPLYRRALEINEANHGIDSPSASGILSNLGLLLESSGRLDEAELHLRRALSIDELNDGPDSRAVAIRLSNLGALLFKTDRMLEAEPLLRRALIIAEANFGSNHPEVTFPLCNLASLLQMTDRCAEAEPLFRRALAIDEAIYGPDHPEVGIDLNNLAGLLRESGRTHDTEPLFRQAALIYLKASNSTGHLLPNATITLRNYALVLAEIGREDEDLGLAMRSVVIEAGLDPAKVLPIVFADIV